MNQKYLIIISFLAIIFISAAIFIMSNRTPATPAPDGSKTAVSAPETDISTSSEPAVRPSNPIKTPTLGLPLTDALSRVSKKPFGIKVSPGHSPVSPERFSGSHTGVDFEIQPGEENSDVPVSAICDGSVLATRRVSGYGGVLVQNCTIEKQTVTVLYGHLKLSSMKLKSGDTIKKAEHIGILGAAYSYDTDGERKHLHLSIHNGDKIVYLGYAQKESDLSSWLDFIKLYK